MPLQPILEARELAAKAPNLVGNQPVNRSLYAPMGSRDNETKSFTRMSLQCGSSEPVKVADTEEHRHVVVLDTGSMTLRAGFGDADEPRHELHSLVGRPKINPVLVGMQIKTAYFGTELVSKRRLLITKRPVENGQVINWNDLESLWHHTFYNELRVDPEKCFVVVTENVQTSLEDREKMARILFETFNAHAMFIANRSLMSLYDSGRTTGLVVQMGHDEGIVVPIIEGNIVEDAVTKLRLGGREVSERLLGLLCERGIQLTIEDTAAMKEENCYVAQDYEAEAKRAKILPSLVQQEFECVDGETITIARERFEAPEVLFKPELHGESGRDTVPLHRAIVSCILKCDSEIRKTMFQNIVLAGGTCMLPGLADRLQGELVQLGVPEGAEVGIHLPHNKNSAWRGAAVLSSVPEFTDSDFWVTKDMYEKQSPSVVHGMSS